MYLKSFKFLASFVLIDLHWLIWYVLRDSWCHKRIIVRVHMSILRVTDGIEIVIWNFNSSIHFHVAICSRKIDFIILLTVNISFFWASRAGLGVIFVWSRESMVCYHGHLLLLIGLIWIHVKWAQMAIWFISPLAVRTDSFSESITIGVKGSRRLDVSLPGPSHGLEYPSIIFKSILYCILSSRCFGITDTLYCAYCLSSALVIAVYGFICVAVAFLFLLWIIVPFFR